MIRGNGIRSGTGTAGDPWVISDWEIKADSATYGQGLRIEGVQGYVDVRDVAIDSTAPAGPYHAIAVVDSPNVSLQGVTVDSRGSGALYVYRSSVRMDHLDLTGDTEFGCIAIGDSAVNASHVTLRGSCDSNQMIGIRGGSLESFTANLTKTTDTFVLTLAEGAFFRMNGIGSTFWEAEPHGSGPCYGCTGFRIELGTGSSLQLVNVTLEGWKDQIRVTHGEDSTFRAQQLRGKAVRDGVLVECNPCTGSSTLLEDVIFRDLDVAVGVSGGNAIIRDALFERNDLAIMVSDLEVEPQETSMRVEESTFIDNDVAIRAEKGTAVLVSGSWLGGDSVKGPVTIENPASGPLRPEDVTTQDSPSLPFAVMCLALAALVVKRRGKSPGAH